MSPRVVATVDLGAIRHNLHQIRARAPRAKVMAAVKADGPGIAQAITGTGFPGDSLAAGKIPPQIFIAGPYHLYHRLQGQPGRALIQHPVRR